MRIIAIPAVTCIVFAQTSTAQTFDYERNIPIFNMYEQTGEFGSGEFSQYSAEAWNDDLYNYCNVNAIVIDKFENETDMDVFDTGVRKFPTGIEKAKIQGGVDLDYNTLAKYLI